MEQVTWYSVGWGVLSSGRSEGEGRLLPERSCSLTHMHRNAGCRRDRQGIREACIQRKTTLGVNSGKSKMILKRLGYTDAR